MNNSRVKNIYKNINQKDLPFKLSENNFHIFGNNMSNFIINLLERQNSSANLKWCFSNIKKTKVFLTIFHANEANQIIYKEEIAKKLREYSYKTISKIIDDGVSLGIYINLKPNNDIIQDGKVKSIRPSEELLSDFYNWSIGAINSVVSIIKKHQKH